MRKKQANKAKMCPFLDQNCVKGACEIYNPILNRCDISLVAYNLYLVSEGLKPSNGDNSDSD